MGSPKSMRSAPAVGAVAAVAAQDASCGNLQSPRVVTTLRSDSHASTGFCSRSPPKVFNDNDAIHSPRRHGVHGERRKLTTKVTKEHEGKSEREGGKLSQNTI